MKRPDGMSFEEYKTFRRQVSEAIRSALRGRYFHVSKIPGVPGETYVKATRNSK